MNIEQASKGFIAEADPPKLRGRPVLDLGSEQLRHWISSAGVMMSARMEEEGSGNTGSSIGGVHASTGTPRGAGWASRVAERFVGLWTPSNVGRGKEPQVRNDDGRIQGFREWHCLVPRY